MESDKLATEVTESGEQAVPSQEAFPPHDLPNNGGLEIEAVNKANKIVDTEDDRGFIEPESKSKCMKDVLLEEGEGSSKGDEEDMVNVHQFYPEIDILTSTVISDSNVAETDDYKFGGDESPPTHEESPQMLAITDQLVVEDTKYSPETQITTNSQPETKGFGVFSATQLGEEELPPKSNWTISPEFDMVEIINTKAADHSRNALTHQSTGDLERAIRDINKVMCLRSNQSAHFIQRAEIFLQLSDFQSAILNYKKACFLEPENSLLYERLAFIFYFQGQVFFDQRLFAEALEAFSRASEMLPNKTGFHTRSIACLAALQRHGECLALVNRRLEVDKHNPDLYIMRARLHEMFGNMTLCYYDIKDALALDEEHSEALSLRRKMEIKAEENKVHSQQLSIMGKQREALQKLNIAIEMNPAVAEYHVLRGALQRKLGEFNEAIDDFLLALDKADHQEETDVYTDSQRQLLLTYNDFAIECFTKGYYEEAIILLNKATKGEKEEKGLYINRGDCFFRQGELTFALQDYHQALELDCLDTDVKSRISIIHSEFGVMAYHSKNYPEAESKFTLAIQYNPRVGQYYITRSRCRYLLEDMKGARSDLVMGLLLDPTNEEILSILSRLFPGKSVKEVLDSELGVAARQALGNLIPMASPIRLQPIPPTPALIPLPQETTLHESTADKPGSPQKPKPTFDLKGGERSQLSGGQRLTLKTPNLMSEIVTEKKTLKSMMNAVFHDRKSLKYNGPRLKPLPPLNPQHPCQKGLKERETIDERALVATKSTNWRKFNVGIGSLTML